MPKYSIIIIASNGIELTSRCVESIFSHTRNFELIVVDNNTTDGTNGYLMSKAENNSNLKIIKSEKNLTFAENNNIGLKLAEGEFIIFLNNDTEVSADWLERMEQHFTRTPFKNVGAVGPVSSSSNGIQMVGKQDAEQWHENYRGHWKHTGVLYGWCMMFKREVLEKIGGFDERFENSHEDNDLSLRTQLAGYSLIVAYDVYIDHFGQGTLRRTMKDVKEYEQKGMENRERYFKKWYTPEKKKKLVAVYRTAGGNWLETSLAQTSKFADHIIIHFCRAPGGFHGELFLHEKSTGKFIYSREQYVEKLKQAFPKITKIEFYDGIFQEDYERNWLLQEALKLQEQGEADWCISVDDDEIYEDKFIDRVQAYMNPYNPEVLGYWCNWRTIWEKRLGKEYYRTDSTFGSFTNYRFFRLIPNQVITSHHPEGHHCGSAPWLPDENLRWLGIRVKHMGYDTPEQRQKKFEFYEKNDNFKTKRDIGYDDYSHLISLNPQLQEYHEKQGVTLLAMVKNEEEYLLGMLENVQYFVDEYVIVDTGSTDKTLQILEDFKKYSIVPVKILHHPWVDNYSIPRNYGKQFATQKWILHMDADERFRPQDTHFIFKHTETDLDVVMININNYLEKPRADRPTSVAPTQSARLFRNVPELFYSGIIHETLDDSTTVLRKQKKFQSTLSPVTLHHYGYLKDKKRVRGKLDYYETLNTRQLEVTEGKDARPHFNLALHWMNEDKNVEALKALQTALSINPRFYHASQQMAALNIKNAKHFLTETLKYMPENHPARGQTKEMLDFLNSKSCGNVKVA